MVEVKALWFAFKLVSLNHWKQHTWKRWRSCGVVICFQISIFEPLETTPTGGMYEGSQLWFAFKLVSLNHWKQLSASFHEPINGCDLLSN